MMFYRRVVKLKRHVLPFPTPGYNNALLAEAMTNVDAYRYICSPTKILLRIVETRPTTGIINMVEVSDAGNGRAPCILALLLNRVVPKRSEGSVA